ncbi:MAG: hypothetical protein ACUVX9_12585 [Anaerolineae bacterium]
MFLWRRRRVGLVSARGAAEQLAHRIAERPQERSSCRLLIADYGRWRDVVSRQLHAHRGDDVEVAQVLRGRLSGECPECQARFSAEYLEWLCSPDAAGHPAGARFAAGSCPNASCTSSEMILYWLPTPWM